MTEQEKLEKNAKDVKEMIEIAFPTYRTELDVIAIQRLHDKGYRKAKEIFAKCKEKCMFEGYPYGIDYTELVEVFKEFCVDIEE